MAPAASPSDYPPAAEHESPALDHC
jgi:hypothetical protein